MRRAELVDQFFTAALEQPDSERERWVRSRCGDDAELAEQVLDLVRRATMSAGEVEGRFGAVRDRLWRDVFDADPEFREDLSGGTVGVWRLEKRLASGGLATVYLASRNDGAFRQQAAFKVLRRGLDTEDLVRRFRAEREILSSLNHPGIARILDGGAMQDGRPFLVLEYVDGRPITEHCELNGLGLRERAALFLDVARAIGHAHRRLVVHRDIKPSNILVGSDGRVSVLDFGIAKLLDPQAWPTDSVVTRAGVSMFTPAYASPEQCSGGAVTTSSDVYQLGLVLYELLSGQRPEPKDPVTSEGVLPAPSRVALDPSLGRRLQGDLDAIVLKAAHADPERRYGGTGELVADLERYLDGRPVLARPDSWAYRLGKLNRRKPWLLPLLALLVVALVGYVATLSVYSARLAKEQRLSAATETFLLDLFKSSDPLAPSDEQRGREITVVEALDAGARRARTELAEQPELQATLLAAISDVYASLDQFSTAAALREEVLVTERAVHGERSIQVLTSLRKLGNWYGALGDRGRAGKLLRQQLALAGERPGSEADQLGLAQIALGMEMKQAGEFVEGQALLQAGIANLRPAGERHAREMIAALVAFTEQFGMESADDAFAVIAEAEQIARQAFGEDSLTAATVRARLAATLTQFGDYAGSERNFLAAVPVIESQLGPTHSITISTINNLGYLYNRSGQHAKAEALYRGLLERQLAGGGGKDRAVGDTYQNLASAVTKQGRYDESLPLHREAFEIFRAVLDDGHFVIAFPLLSMSYVELQRGHATEAEAHARDARARLQAALPGSFLEGVAMCLTGLALERQGRSAEGEPLVLASHAMLAEGSVPAPYPELCRVPGAGPVSP